MPKLIESFDAYSSALAVPISGKWSGGNMAAASIITGRWGAGTGAVSFTNRSTAFFRKVVSAGQVLIGGAIRFTVGSENSLALIKFIADDDLTDLGDVVFTPEGRIGYQPGVLQPVVGYGDGVAPNIWNYLEVRLIPHASSGTFDMWLNGQHIAALSGVRTAAITPTSIGSVQWGYDAGPVVGFDLDDVYLDWGASGDTLTRLGDSRIDVIRPRSDSSVTNWKTEADATTGLYAKVNDQTPSGDAAYIKSTTVSAKAIFDSTDVLIGTPSHIHAVAVNGRGVKSDAGVRSVQGLLSSNSVEALGTEHFLAAGQTAWHDCYNQNPDGTVDWTKSTVEAALFGVKLTS